ncbi:MAG TPA: arginyltransferase, partial [Xanthomonadales bacterium]|nr:arginyltransferase [Xanthomonadales bacterium]
RYLGGRHAGGGMDESQPDDFSRFLTSPWSDTRFVTFRRHGRLFGVAVTDWTPHGLSAVYTFYDTTEPDRGLGTFAILTQIELTRVASLPHLYLGYWIDQHAKMHYKARFRPLEVLRGEKWERLAPR